MAGGEQRLSQIIVIGKNATGLVTQGHDDGTGQGRYIDNLPGLVASNVGEGVAEHQPALSIGVQNFHRLTTHAGHHIPGFGGTAAGHVLSCRYHTNHVDGQVELCHCPDRTQHRGSAAHVKFHFVHLGARLQRNATGIEGYAFADDGVGLFLGLATLVFQHNELGWLIAAMAYGE